MMLIVMSSFSTVHLMCTDLAGTSFSSFFVCLATCVYHPWRPTWRRSCVVVSQRWLCQWTDLAHASKTDRNTWGIFAGSFGHQSLDWFASCFSFCPSGCCRFVQAPGCFSGMKTTCCAFALRLVWLLGTLCCLVAHLVVLPNAPFL